MKKKNTKKYLKHCKGCVFLEPDELYCNFCEDKISNVISYKYWECDRWLGDENDELDCPGNCDYCDEQDFCDKYWECDVDNYDEYYEFDDEDRDDDDDFAYCYNDWRK